MKVPDPYDRLTPAARRRGLVLMLCASCVLLFVMQQVGEPLKTGAAPGGIVSFELAGTPAAAAAIMASWSPPVKMRAAFSLGIDYLFLVVYALFISLACRQSAEAISSSSRFFHGTGLLLAWAQFPAGALDAVENTLLWQVLQGSTAVYPAAAARWCAILKFALVGMGLGYVSIALIVLGVSRLRGKVKTGANR
jgi:hypothetical protein